MSGPAWAEGPAPFPEFEAKRIKPPAPGTRKRITVQIEPDQAPAPAQVTAQEDGSISVGTGGGTSPGRYAWFWDKISPELAQSGPGRTTDAFIALQTSGDVAAPRLQILQDIAKQRGIPILKSTIGTNVSPALVLAVISVESSGRADAVSSAGAQGLMQLMPQTAARFGVKDSLAPEDNIAGGVRYLDWLMQEFGNDPILALAGYNAGAGAVRKHDGVPPYAETRDYVPKVLAAFQVAKRLCVTPPELVSDGCVFSVMN
jgi:soluble lytic murein transglycosylase-like protein